jgi:hypothetical protein
MAFCNWLTHTWFIAWVSNSVVIAIFIELTHYFSLFLLVGSIVIVDLRVMGLAARINEIYGAGDGNRTHRQAPLTY